MRDEAFQLFIEDVGEATFRTPVLDLSLEKYGKLLPGKLLEYWREEGWCGYADGLFWTVNPEDYDGLADLWLSGTPYEKVDRYHIVARSAFGNLYAWGERNHRTLTIACPTHALIGIDKELRTPAKDPDVAVQAFFASMDRQDFDMKDASKKYLFERALKKLGPLAPDEIYGFEPALVAGGKNRLENLRKVNLFAHLAILRELAAPTVPFARFDPGEL
ncbi:DUF1851 domain-containing protein [Archangium violaceum]|uniref:GAD-like domain-containing protein n=1 Tax=Archangium violaceum TaxID=83451 RepID=UPI002B3042D1|nr:DUF1851 domain-containing protein [Archangium violaceum]